MIASRALGHRTTYGYDELGNRTSQTDANTHVTRFEYDKLGRQTRRILPDGKTESMTYDAAGNLETRTDFMARTTTYDYDVNHRLLSRTYPDSTSVGFTYTETGRRRTAVDARGTTTYDYDTRDRLRGIEQPGVGSLSYTYDGNGNRLTLSVTIGPDTHTTSYTYDDASRLDLVTDPMAQVYDHGYDPNGNRTSLAHPNGAITAYTYDTLNRLTNLGTTIPSLSRTVQSYAFTLGPAGNRTRITEHDSTVRDYSYDDLYRLTGERVTETIGLVYEKTFGYDPVGNRQSQATTLGPAGSPGPNLQPGTISYGYDSRDRLTLEGGQAYTWDDNGNLTTKDAEATYTWDFENRLIKVTKTDGTVVEHLYDADGNRVQTKTTPPAAATETTNLLVDASGSLSHVVAETDDSGNLKAYYVRGDDLLAVMRPAGGGSWTSRFAHVDGLGSLRRLTDTFGNITDAWSYTAFGEVYGRTGTDPIPYAFAGEPLDPNSGFQYHRARWMDPRVGRFSATDPHPGSIEEPLTLHRYVYAGADPVNKTDPNGLFFSLSVSLTAIGISNTIHAISVPIAEALISATASLELVPIWVRDRRWSGTTQLLGPFPGWPAEDVQAQLGQARSVWGRAGVVIHTAAERGPIIVDDSNIPRGQPGSGQRIEEFIRAAGIQSVRTNEVPVVFIRTIGGTTRKGRAFGGSLRESASMAMPLGASELSLAHEVGHVLGLDHHFIPWNLIFPLALGGSDLTERQAATAREGVRIRSGGR